MLYGICQYIVVDYGTLWMFLGMAYFRALQYIGQITVYYAIFRHIGRYYGTRLMSKILHDLVYLNYGIYGTIKY